MAGTTRRGFLKPIGNGSPNEPTGLLRMCGSCNGLALILVERPQTNPRMARSTRPRERAPAGRAQGRHPARCSQRQSSGSTFERGQTMLRTHRQIVAAVLLAAGIYGVGVSAGSQFLAAEDPEK